MQTRSVVAMGICLMACGPLPPNGGTGEGTTEGSETTTGDPTTTGQPTTGEPTTSSTSATSSTVSTTDVPECSSDEDCGFGECSYCIEGSCEYSPGCCGLMPGPGGDLQFRCIGYECYGDDECGDGEECDQAPGFCAPLPTIPTCEQQALALSSLQLQGTPSAIELVDLDGDGALDLVAALPDAGMIEVAVGDGSGGFSPGVLFPSKLEPGAHRIAWADFDGDGDPDLAISRPVPTGELSLLFGEDAMFADAVLLTLGSTPGEVWAGDFDGDGKADLAAHNLEGLAPLTLRLGDGLGGFGEELGGGQLNGQGFAAAAADVTGDGQIDFVTSEEFGPGIRVLEWQNGGFAQGMGASFHGSIRQEWLVTGDLDGDAVADVAGFRLAPEVGVVALWRSNDPPELTYPGTLQLGAVGDVDGDGFGDVVALEAEPTALRVIFTGGAACVQAIALAQPSATELLATGDVDGDGRADVVAGTFAGAEVAILRGGP